MDDENDRVGAAADLAREMAPDLDSILVTLYPDGDTLDTIRPGDADVATANAVARAVAEAMAEACVEVFVQRADRGAFRRWLAGREDRPEVRRGWVDRGRLLRGDAAFRALGLTPPPPEPPPRFPRAPGPIADELLAACEDRESGEFDAFLDALIEAGRGDVLDLALRKIRERQSDENAAELRADLLAAAEGAAIGPSGWAELVALPVALSPGAAPDAVALADGLIASGGLAPEEELRILPGWRSPDAIEALSPLAMRRVLLDLVADREPSDLPPGDTDELARRGFGVLVGLRIDWNIPIWDVIEAEGGLPEEPPEEDGTPEERGRARALDRWRGRVAAESDGCVPLDLVPLSDVGGAMAGFLEEAGGHLGGLDEIRQFIEVARREAGGEEVVCRPGITGGALELTLTTAGGRFLDSLTLSLDRLPASPDGVLSLLGAFVRLVGDAPGR
ncbi:hypothetical protein [Roseicella aquatilis]|uniref:Uncharacterized protein n=1 Tax=Roseicella aquatilis TaxID=2527868 RepID=A0A4R4D557_9PROT|nr:hypothetical protein [Roseicella aquatilis]TCZ54222.1 hypothetical protein EXY23_23595 [Roseicella aquatilis]